MEGIKQLNYVRKIDKMYPEFKFLVFVLKCFLKIRNLSETYGGGIGSFLLFSMILTYLQTMHRKQKQYNLAEYLIGFLKFYGEEDWSDRIVYPAEGTIEYRSKDSVYFSCMSPQDMSHDIGRSAFRA